MSTWRRCRPPRGRLMHLADTLGGLDIAAVRADRTEQAERDGSTGVSEEKPRD